MKDLTLQDLGTIGNRFKQELESAEFGPFFKIISSTEINECKEQGEERASLTYTFAMKNGSEFFVRFTKHGCYKFYRTREAFLAQDDSNISDTIELSEFVWNILPNIEVDKLTFSMLQPELPQECFGLGDEESESNDDDDCHDWDDGAREWLSEAVLAHILSSGPH